MLYAALYRNKPGVTLKSKDVIDKSRKWWNEGGKPAGIKTLAIYGTLGTAVPELLGVGLFVWHKETHAAAEPTSLAMVAWRAANNAAASRRPCWVSW